MERGFHIGAMIEAIGFPAFLNISRPTCVLIVVIESARSAVSPPGIAEIVEDSLRGLRGSGSRFPQLGSPYARGEQLGRENGLERYLNSVDAEMRNTSRTQKAAGRITGRIASLFAQIATYALDSEGPFIGSLLRDGFSRIGLDLARSARRLDSEVSMADILQAARNAWTACGLQLLLGKPLRLTPAIFAYSMLYPYTDNYLDQTAVSRDSKLRFSKRFRRRLEGDRLAPADRREDTIWQLVGFIESEYPRASFPQVYDSLLHIHHAQQESIFQLRGRQSDIDVARLTVTKGGTSVLADAYLAAGNLTEVEARFAFNWGVVLQLGDDLQDFHSDRKSGSLTLFTQAAERGNLDEITNRTLNFSQGVMRQMDGLANCREELKHLLARSSRLLLIRSAAAAPEWYTASFLDRLERHSPFGFAFLRDREQRFARRRRSYSRLFEQALNSTPDSRGPAPENWQMSLRPAPEVDYNFIEARRLAEEECSDFLATQC
jgi:hypothetical protein